MVDSSSSSSLPFDFSLYKRNGVLETDKGMHPPKTLKTGTTIAGLIYKDGVVLGADTRATEGPIVADKNCSKIHYLSPTMYCCGAGTAADTENTTSMVSSQLKLHHLSTGKTPRVTTACTLFKQYLFQYQGHISAALVLGGVDSKGAHLFSIAPHGSVDCLPYVTMGSGSLAAMAMFESEFRPEMEEEEAKSLVHKAISAGIFNDLGSGSNVDLCVIRLNGEVEFLRGYDRPNDVNVRYVRDYKYPTGTTAVLSTKIDAIRSNIIVQDGPAPMEL